eukprot:g2969.t1
MSIRRLNYLSRALCAKEDNELKLRMQNRRSRLDAIMEELPADVEKTSFPLPPLASMPPDNDLFPTFKDMMNDKKSLGPIFSYKIVGGTRRMTVVTDPEIARLIYFPDNERVKHNAATLAYHWFGIDKEMSKKYTDKGLRATRQALKPVKVQEMNDRIAMQLLNLFRAWEREAQEKVDVKAIGNGSGNGMELNLWDVAEATFWPVNACLFGANVVSPQSSPEFLQYYSVYNSSFEQVANGIPRSAFPEMENAAAKISQHFGQALAEDPDATQSLQCPMLKARIGVMEKSDLAKYSSEQKGRFMLSVFWAAQANTVPGTFWVLYLILQNPSIKQRVIEEVRNGSFREMYLPKNRNQTQTQSESEEQSFQNRRRRRGARQRSSLTTHLPLVNACVREMLRLKVANITNRKVAADILVKHPISGEKILIPSGDMLTVASYLSHHDPTIFPEPERFHPDRWLNATGEKRKQMERGFFPFGKGPHACSGKWLALMEIPTLVALFFREYDVTLLPSKPGEEVKECWENVVAMVNPIRPFDARVHCVRRK